jgi:carboxymethylenebutenolidase
MGWAEAAAAARAAGGKNDDEFLADIGGGIAALRALSNSNGKVGVIGFCSGGRQAILAASAAPIDAAVDCYGAMVVGEPVPGFPLQPIPERLPDVACPVLGIFGAEDKNPSPDAVAELGAILAQHGKTFEPHSFEGAGHSFLQADRAASRPEAAAKAWPLIDEFFARHLTS